MFEMITAEAWCCEGWRGGAGCEEVGGWVIVQVASCFNGRYNVGQTLNQLFRRRTQGVSERGFK